MRASANLVGSSSVGKISAATFFPSVLVSERVEFPHHAALTLPSLILPLVSSLSLSLTFYHLSSYFLLLLLLLLLLFPLLLVSPLTALFLSLARPNFHILSLFALF